MHYYIPHTINLRIYIDAFVAWVKLFWNYSEENTITILCIGFMWGVKTYIFLYSF